MPRPTYILCLNTVSQDITTFKIQNETVYGGSYDDRGDNAEYLLVAKIDENQNLTFIDGIDNTLPLSALEWDITSEADGSYRAFYISIAPWLVGTDYVKEVLDEDDNIESYADITYDDGVVYKAIDDSTGVQPGVTSGWEDYWEIVTDLTTLIEYGIDKDSIYVHIHDDILDFQFQKCVRDELDDASDLILNGLCDKIEKLLPILKMQLLLDGARSNNWQDKQTRSEVILVEGKKKFCC